jgi:hypothetical protein
MRIVAAFALLTVPALSFSQERWGAITGVVRSGDAVADATVEAKNMATGVVYSTTTEVDGFALSRLPPGTYEIAVPPLGWRTERFVQSEVAVGAGETVRLEIELTLANQGVLGDDLGFLAVRNQLTGVEGEVPRTAEGRTDLSGVWHGNVDPNEAVAELLPWAAEELAVRTANAFRDMPTAVCLPSPTPVWPTIYRFVQTPTMLVQLFEFQPGYRQVFLGGREHPEDIEPSWMGHSIGWWEGDTLVVDTVGFNDRSWLWNSAPHTEQLHVVERFSRPTLGELRVDVTMEDPGALAAPWQLHLRWRLAPGEEVLEYICNENNLYSDNIGGQ